jgi:hypothetical protein
MGGAFFVVEPYIHIGLMRDYLALLGTEEAYLFIGISAGLAVALFGVCIVLVRQRGKRKS